MASRCDACGAEEYMPYVCKFCKGKHCAAHRLPENHACAGLGEYRERMREQGRVFNPEVTTRIQPRVSSTARAAGWMEQFWRLVDGRMTWVFLGVILGIYILEMIVLNFASRRLFVDLFTMGPLFLIKPWTIVTSIFAHGSPNHLFGNALFLIFFGAAVEKLLGTRRFTYLFLAAGAIAGVAQVIVVNYFVGCVDCVALGASGALYGVMGFLVVLAPTLTVLVFFVIPAPLWAMVALFVFLDLTGMFNPNDGVARIAHLSGLAVGAYYAWTLRKKGMRVEHQPPPSIRRHF